MAGEKPATPIDQGFLINANRIRVSRDLRLSRKGQSMDSWVNIPVPGYAGDASDGEVKGPRADGMPR